MTEAAPAPLLEVRDLTCGYGPARRQAISPVLRDVSFALPAGETLALVGESGSGKTTLARAVAGLLVPRSGKILYAGREMGSRIELRPRDLHREIQFVFQNPDASLNPRYRVADIVGRPLEFFFGLQAAARQRRVEQLLEAVHLDAGCLRRFPRELSGGERQRVAIAQALAAEPRLALCDEIVSALDVSVQAAILDLLRELQLERKIAYLFIGHDLAVVRWLAHRVGVLYRGLMMEIGLAEEVFRPPYHPYTRMLLESVPEPDPGQHLPSGDERAADVAEPARWAGCPFAARCPRRLETACDRVDAPWRDVSPTHAIRCHIPVAEL